MPCTGSCKSVDVAAVVQEELHNYEDFRCLREAKESEKNAPTIGLDELRKQIRGRASRSRFTAAG